MRRLAVLLLIPAAVGAVTCAQVENHKQPEACKVALECYFGTSRTTDLSQIDAGPGDSFEGLKDHQLFKAAYGENGSCWNADLDLAHACEERCRALLAQDCAAPYTGTDTPFCADRACDFSVACIQQGNSFSSCPASETFPKGKCLLFDAGPDDAVSIGCCADERGNPPADNCRYRYQESPDGTFTESDVR